MAAHRVWIEAALNGPWGQARQPGIPSTVEAIVAEGIACASAGAAIIHVHAYDAPGTAQTFDWQVYARIIEGIRAKVDVPVYPSIPSAALAPGGEETSPAARFAHTEELARRGLLELSVVDPGSVNFASFNDVRLGRTGHVYLNPEPDIRYGLALAAKHGFHPGYAIYEPG
ncbi:MAG TPA: 3-keto-5-aminohexanoate cleavage protein, partial [Hyphomicrobiaceae bacterium]|nr:3-keto-5-aminohexanoate cleavage protein [Hyphomicrobiaceae bacterium]